MKRISCWVLLFLLCCNVGLADDKATLQAAQKEYPTPRLMALWQTARHDPDKLIGFYQNLADKHVIDTIAGEEEAVLVTYFALGSADTDYILQSGGPDFFGLRFKQIANSRLYFCTQRIPKDAMFIYGYNEFTRKREGDVFVTEMRHIYDGAVIGPDAPLSDFLQPSDFVAKGQLIEREISSQAFGGKRKITLYLPADYSPQRRYKTLIMFDGRAFSAPPDAADAWRSWVPTPTILDNMIAAKRVAPTVAVFIWNQGRRDTDLIGAQMQTFVVDELLSWLRKEYAVSNHASDVVLAGASRGGYSAASIALARPDKIGNVLSQTGSYWITAPDKENWPVYPEFDGHLIDAYKQSAALPVRFYLSAGLYDLGAAYLGSNRQLRDILQVKGYAVMHTEFKGGHAYLNWRHDLPIGLEYLLGQRQ